MDPIVVKLASMIHPVPSLVFFFQLVHLHIKEVVAIGIGNVVANALGEVGHHVDASGIKDFAQLSNPLGALGPGDAGLEHRSVGLALDESLVGCHSDGSAGEAAGRVEGRSVEGSDGRAQCLGGTEGRHLDGRI